jgi:Uma2 family endonuclease
LIRCANRWVVNLRETCLEFFREPLNGEYESHVIIDRAGRMSPLAFPKLKLALTQLFDWYET